jgi:chemotaxis protein MotB
MARRRQPVAPENHDRWLISYADFITLLLALFVVMFASSQPDKKKARQVSYAVTEALESRGTQGAGLQGGGLPVERKRAPPKVEILQPKAAVPPLTTSMQYLNEALAQEIKTGKIEVHLDIRGLVISLRQAAYFPSGGDAIAPSGFASIEKIAGTIRDLPNAVQLEGHTDSAPIHTRRFRSNWELSAARSIAMLELFAGRYGIPRSRFAVAGYAETKPVDSNDSAEGRAHNRRVDIVILNQQSS